ncbi:MAG: tetratricopeptide repeat protein, partial [Gammaproteobacteria bacterium]|nr:tetratricopeptide repeat protein [Gammaproteobacteria bacterium]
ALKDKGESDAAIESYKKALKIKPDYAEAYNNMGNALLNKGEPDPAIESYKKALKIKPDYAGAYNSMGNALKDKGEPDPAIESFKKALKIKPDYAEAYNNMGNALLDKGDPEAAIESYKMAIKIKPDHADAYNNMGAALKDKEESGAAIESYKKALEIKPDYAGPKHLIAALTGSTTDSAPRAYVESLFDDYACKFDNSLVGKLDYKIPKTLAQIILANTTGHSLGSILDLGCGTGLAGVELKGSSQNLEGIDLSSSMLEEARKKNAYDRLIHTDLIEYLSTADLDFDYFVSTDVFIYVGELSDVFRLIKSRNKCAGKLAFSTEHTEKEGFFLETSGRYSHSKRYIEKLCEKFEYRILHFSTTNLRKEKNGYLTGGLYLLDFAPKL